LHPCPSCPFDINSPSARHSPSPSRPQHLRFVPGSPTSSYDAVLLFESPRTCVRQSRVGRHLAHPRATFDTLMRTFDTLSLNIRTSAWTPYWTRRSPASSSRLSSLTKGTCARTWTDVLHCGDLENTGIQGLNRVSTLTSFSSFPTKMSSLACANCLHNTVVHVLTVSASLHSSHHIPRPDFKHEMARRGVSESRYLAYSLSLTLSTRAPSGSLAPNTRWRRGSLDRPLLYFLDIELWGFLTRVLNAWPLPCFLDVDIDTRPSKDDLVSP
jgi:hypothetical protein